MSSFTPEERSRYECGNCGSTNQRIVQRNGLGQLKLRCNECGAINFV